MTRYVCDFDVVRKTANSLNNYAGELEASVNKCVERIDAINWEGTAADAVRESIRNYSEVMKKNFNEMRRLGEFMKYSSNEIEKIESRYGSVKF